MELFDIAKLASYRENNRIEAKFREGRPPAQHMGDLLRFCQHLRRRHSAWCQGARRRYLRADWTYTN